MKALLFIFAILFSVNVWACPDIRGEYICDSKGKKFAATVLQEQNKNGTMVYQINSKVFIADGQWHEFHPNNPDAMAKTNCAGNALIIDIEFDWHEGGEVVGVRTTRSHITPAANMFQVEIIGQLTYDDGRVLTDSEAFICHLQ